MEHGFPSHRHPGAAPIERTPEEEEEHLDKQEERLQSALHNRLHHQRTIFSPGARIRMNVIPLFLNVLIPWAVFIFCCGLTSFSVMYTARSVVYALIALLVLLWLSLVSFAVGQRKKNPDPTWWSYTALAIGVAMASGLVCGSRNYETLSRPFYEIQDLKVIHQLHVGSEQGQNFMDAGIVYFAAGSELDRSKSWHFKHHTIYCVAPIVDNSLQFGATSETSGITPSYDFWAVGKDCCSPSSSDFRCGAWGSAKARSALRTLDDSAIPFYRLAVQQAETLYGVVAAHPIFFEWIEDPLAQVNSWSARVFRDYLFMVATALVVFLFAAALATCSFSMVGRKGSQREKDYFYDQNWGDFYNDDAWRKGLSDYHSRYSTL